MLGLGRPAGVPSGGPHATRWVVRPRGGRDVTTTLRRPRGRHRGGVRVVRVVDEHRAIERRLEFEAALYRAYNRYMGEQCAFNPQRLKWGGLLPLRDTMEGIKAIEEMQRLGAVAAVVFGTAGERLLSDRGFGQNIDDTLTRFRTFIREYESGTLIPSRGVK